MAHSIPGPHEDVPSSNWYQMVGPAGTAYPAVPVPPAKALWNI